MKTNEDNVQRPFALIDCLHVGDKRLAQYLYQGAIYQGAISGSQWVGLSTSGKSRS